MMDSKINKMKNNGKSLEKTIQLIQETLKDSGNTEIFSNYKIENESGQKREIDILIISSINNFKIKIAIECKDYNKKVPVKEIEAFAAKCDRIKDINKKVFISTNGYQKDAINSAKYFGIELHTANKLGKEDIENWLPIEQIGFRILPEKLNSTMFLDASEDKLKEISKEYDGLVYHLNYDKSIKLLSILDDFLEKNKRYLMNMFFIEWIKLPQDEKDEMFSVKLNFSFNDVFIKTDNNETINLFGLELILSVISYKKDLNIVEGRILKDQNENCIARSIKIDIGANLNNEVILSENNELSFFLTNELGETQKLSKLFSFDPKTNKFNKT